MSPLALTGTAKIIAGLILGISFGIILVKSENILRPAMKRAIALKDYAFIRIIMFSIAIGAIMFYFCYENGLVNYNYASTHFWGVFLGSLFVGIGFSLCGQYFISSLGGIVTGKIYSVWVILGMIIAVPFHSPLKSFFNNTIYSLSEPIKINSLFSDYISIYYLPLWVGVLLIISVLIMQIYSGDKN